MLINFMQMQARLGYTRGLRAERGSRIGATPQSQLLL